MTRRARIAIGDRLLRFAADRAIETREMQRRMAALDPDTPGVHGLQGALAAAKVWETVVLWIAWRLQPRVSADL